MNLSGTKKAPPVSVVLPHYIFGAISFFVLTLLIFISTNAFTGHYFHPHLLAVTHVAALGWISMIILGALYQLLPVIMLAELYSNNLARFSFVLFGAGIILLSVAFYQFNVGLIMQLASIFIVLAVFCFATNVFLTEKKSDEKSIESDFITASVFWLLVTVVIGAILVFNFTYPFLEAGHLHYLKLHSHLGFAGWFVLLIMGVGSKLIPMFLLSSAKSGPKLKFAYYSVNLALLGFFIDALVFKSTDRGILYFIVALTGIASFLQYIYDVFKNRARKILDAGMKHSMLAFVLMLIPVITGIIVHGGLLHDAQISAKIILTYGSSFLIGFISLLVLGQTFKTLPFIVWLHKYKTSTHSVTNKQILPKDMFSENLLKWQFGAFIIAYIILQIGIQSGNLIVLKCAGGLLVLTALMYNVNVFKIVSHVFKK